LQLQKLRSPFISFGELSISDDTPCRLHNNDQYTPLTMHMYQQRQDGADIHTVILDHAHHQAVIKPHLR